MNTQSWMARAASCAALVLGLGCGQTGGTTEGGETGQTSESTATSADTSSGSATLTGSGGPTETGGSEGQTESATGETTSTSGETTTTSTSGETTTTSTSGETTTTGTTAETTTSTTGPDTTGETSTGGNLCDEFEQPGCIDKGCPEGQTCEIGLDCVPSACVCDPVTEQINCTPDCGGGTCVASLCDPVVCNLFCEFGFQKDEQGCEICACNEPPAPDCGCESDADCVKASPGCCSCNMGGAEVAVATACLDQLEPCPFPPGEVVCPAVYLCTDAQAVCMQGECVLQ
ncbi:hypothetical protein [Nannocystis radixulma]|uniref:Antistasin-like domain-containing protein n=1 Tax=Nannocystis radixulma TaxID=2995305 RepID=A0ABT5BKR1_9BACT|nr:hypothetical protein [Nannocystis radixulma]MDC0674129.1 hypothetical protein [Nannocystis radixulma]